jgi:heme/copper-type cytochrome/quinol oxidase subunit 4
VVAGEWGWDGYIRIDMKHFIFKFFGYIALSAFSIILVMAFYFSQQNMWPVIVALVSATFSFVYFVHKQKLEELRLFKELFEGFTKTRAKTRVREEWHLVKRKLLI